VPIERRIDAQSRHVTFTQTQTGGSRVGRRTNYGFEKRQRATRKLTKKEAKVERMRLRTEEAEGANPGEAEVEVEGGDDAEPER
jgi:hypothetical protein